MYRIVVDRPNSLIEVELGGMMAAEEVAAYIAELKRLFIGNKLRRYAMVIDVTHCPIQSQDMIRAMAQHMATMPKAHALGVVTGTSLARIQARRLFVQPYARITATVAEARAWVLQGIEPKAA